MRANEPASISQGMKLSVLTKLLATVALLVALLVVVGLVGIKGLSSVAATSKSSFTNATEPIAALGAAKAAINENRAFTNLHILQTDEAVLSELETKIAANEKLVTERLAAVRPTLVNADGKAAYQQVMADLATVTESRKAVLELSRKNENTAAFTLVTKSVLPQSAKLGASFDKLMSIKVKLADTQERAVGEATTRRSSHDVDRPDRDRRPARVRHRLRGRARDRQRRPPGARRRRGHRRG